MRGAILRSLSNDPIHKDTGNSAICSAKGIWNSAIWDLKDGKLYSSLL